MMKRNTKKKAVLWLLMICLLIAPVMQTGATETKEIITYTDYYDPETDWANECDINMDGEISFVIPDYNIDRAELILVDRGQSCSAISYVKSKAGENLTPVQMEGDGLGFLIYSMKGITPGEWTVKLTDGQWQRMEAYLLIYSKNTAKFAILDYLYEAESGTYQAAMRLYDEETGEVLQPDGVSVGYTVLQEGINNNLHQTKKESDCYVGNELGRNPTNYSVAVLVQTEEGIRILFDASVVDEKEFKDLTKLFEISAWDKFKNKPAEEQKKILMAALVLILSVLIGMILLVRYLKKIEENNKKPLELHGDFINRKRLIEEDRKRLENLLDELTRQQDEEKKELVKDWPEWTKSCLDTEWMEDTASNLRQVQMQNEALIRLWEEELDIKREKGKGYLLMKRMKDSAAANGLTKPQYKERIDRNREVENKVFAMIEKERETLSFYADQITYWQQEPWKKVQIYLTEDTMVYDGMILVSAAKGKKLGIQKLMKLPMLCKTEQRELGRLLELGDRKIKLALAFEDGTPVLISNSSLKGVAELKEGLTTNSFGPYQYLVNKDTKIYIGTMCLEFKV